MDQPDVGRVLFVCTGNYYRSRFAEILFNVTAQERGLSWRAVSRGTDVTGAGRFNVGPLSVWAERALEARGVPVAPHRRAPMQLQEQELFDADLVVAVCETEHRPHLERISPAGAARAEYWAVRDLIDTPADEALAAIERHVLALVERLAHSA